MTAFENTWTRCRTRDVPAWLIVAGLLVLVPGCGEKPKPQPPPPPKVTVAQPVRRVVTDSLELTGNTQAIYTVQLVARVAGYLEKVLFQDGQLVKKGQSLFLIQQNTYEASLRQAEAQILLQQAQLEYAQKQLERFSNLLPNNAASQTDVDNWRFQRDSARANLESARAQRELAQLNLDYTTVTAPFDGRIDRRLQDPGNLVGSGGNTALAQLSQIDPIYVYFNISDLDLARLLKSTHGIPGPGDSRKWPVFAGLPNEDGYPHQGYLDFAAISLTSTTGTLLIRGVLPNPDGRTLPGLYARVRVPLEQREAFLVPDAAIGHDQQGDYVFVVNEKDVVERRGVKTGPAVESLRAIDEGLKGQEWVIVNGLLKAAPGRQVTPEREGSARPPQQGLLHLSRRGSPGHDFRVLHRAADLCQRHRRRDHHHRGRAPLPSARGPVPRDRPADHPGEHAVPGGKRRGRGGDHRRADRAGDQRRRGLHLHVLHQRERRLVYADRHVRRRDGPQHVPVAGPERLQQRAGPASGRRSLRRASRSGRSPPTSCWWPASIPRTNGSTRSSSRTTRSSTW